MNVNGDSKDPRLFGEVGDLEGSGGCPIELYYFYLTTDRPYMTGQEALRIIDRLLDQHQRGSLKTIQAAIVSQVWIGDSIKRSLES